MQSLSTEFLSAAMSAPAQRLSEALKVLKGETTHQATPAPLPDRFMTLTELSKAIGIGRISLWRWRVPGHEHAGRTHYRANEVLAYISDSPEFKKTVQALKKTGWRRPSAAEVANVTLSDPETEASGGAHV